MSSIMDFIGLSFYSLFTSLIPRRYEGKDGGFDYDGRTVHPADVKYGKYIEGFD